MRSFRTFLGAGSARGGCSALAAAAGVVWLATAAAVLSAQAPVEVVVHPERPVQGTLFTVELRPAADELHRIEASFAGEPLHFDPRGDGSQRALAAVPIDAEASLPLEVVIHTAGSGRQELAVDVPITPGSYRLEKLTVAPRFGREPDAATAARISREASRAREVSRRSHGTPRMWSWEFERPRTSRITSGFGHGREFNGQVQSRHMGTDFAGEVGAPVRAPAPGVVALVDSFYLGGNVVYIDHGAGLVSAYLHLSRADVAEGDSVAAGQVIGGVGATGRVTGPHLHWIVRYGSITVDPMSLLQIGEPTAAAGSR